MRRLSSALVVVVVLALAGCGSGDGGGSGGLTLTVSRDFGTRPIAELQAPVRADDTAVTVLERHARVTTAPGGAVIAVDGLGGGSASRPTAWSLYLNGFRVADPATAAVHDGDRVWWDRHGARDATGVRTVVGAFPEPFLHGIDGKRLPVRVECGDGESAACQQVAERLVGYGIPAARGVLRGARVQDTLRVLVGRWVDLRGDEALAQLERGPRESGVYAQPAADGRSITALDPRGAPARSFGAGTGLVAATRFRDEQPVWVVTGTDEAGLAAAVRAFDEGTLGRRFAVLVSDEVPLSLPDVAG